LTRNLSPSQIFWGSRELNLGNLDLTRLKPPTLRAQAPPDLPFQPFEPFEPFDPFDPFDQWRMT
jgi:hypothetical protein